MPADTALDQERLYGISLGKIISESGTLLVDGPVQLRRQLRLNRRARLCLVCTGFDDLLEALWKHSHRTQIWQRLAALNFEFVTSATFSVWDSDPRADQITNQERNFYTFEAFQGVGLPVIPFLLPSAPEDYDRVAEWLELHTEVEHVAVLAQMLKTDAEFSRFLEHLERLREALPRAVRFLVVGCAAQARLEAIHAICPEVTFATSAAVAIARSGHAVDDSLVRFRKADLGRAELVPEVISRYTKFLSRLRSANDDPGNEAQDPTAA